MTDGCDCRKHAASPACPRHGHSAASLEPGRCFEVSALIGPCSEEDAAALADEITRLPECQRVGGAVGYGPPSEELIVENDELARELADERTLTQRLREALRDIEEMARQGTKALETGE